MSEDFRCQECSRWPGVLAVFRSVQDRERELCAAVALGAEEETV